MPTIHNGPNSKKPRIQCTRDHNPHALTSSRNLSITQNQALKTNEAIRKSLQDATTDPMTHGHVPRSASMGRISPTKRSNRPAQSLSVFVRNPSVPRSATPQTMPWTNKGYTLMTNLRALTACARSMPALREVHSKSTEDF